MKQNEYLWEDRPSRYFARIASDEGDDIFCFGHTHQTFHRVLRPAHFVGAGSVGCGGVGDSQARYAVLYVTEATWSWASAVSNTIRSRWCATWRCRSVADPAARAAGPAPAGRPGHDHDPADRGRSAGLNRLGQAAFDSRSYGRPTAAGATLRPTTPASTMMVMM